MLGAVTHLMALCRVQDENRHGDFFAAITKARSEYLDDWKAKLWSRFFCHSVYITMYLNDHQRTAFYEALGLPTKKFNQHVIVETNNATARLFPAVRSRHRDELGLSACACVLPARGLWVQQWLRSGGWPHHEL